MRDLIDTDTRRTPAEDLRAMDCALVALACGWDRVQYEGATRTKAWPIHVADLASLVNQGLIRIHPPIDKFARDAYIALTDDGHDEVNERWAEHFEPLAREVIAYCKG